MLLVQWLPRKGLVEGTWLNSWLALRLKYGIREFFESDHCYIKQRRYTHLCHWGHGGRRRSRSHSDGTHLLSSHNVIPVTDNSMQHFQMLIRLLAKSVFEAMNGSFHGVCFSQEPQLCSSVLAIRPVALRPAGKGKDKHRCQLNEVS